MISIIYPLELKNKGYGLLIQSMEQPVEAVEQQKQADGHDIGLMD